jgi:hypothetical protein
VATGPVERTAALSLLRPRRGLPCPREIGVEGAVIRRTGVRVLLQDHQVRVQPLRAVAGHCVAVVEACAFGRIRLHRAQTFTFRGLQPSALSWRAAPPLQPTTYPSIAKEPALRLPPCASAQSGLPMDAYNRLSESPLYGTEHPH